MADSTDFRPRFRPLLALSIVLGLILSLGSGCSSNPSPPSEETKAKAREFQKKKFE